MPTTCLSTNYEIFPYCINDTHIQYYHIDVFRLEILGYSYLVSFGHHNMDPFYNPLFRTCTFSLGYLIKSLQNSSFGVVDYAVTEVQCHCIVAVFDPLNYSVITIYRDV